MSSPLANGGPSPAAPSIREFTDHSAFRFPDGGGPLIESVILGLMDDFRARIDRGEPHQLTPCLGAPSETPGFFDVGDGRHRLEACRRMGLPVRFEIQAGPYKLGDVNRIRASSLLKRKKPEPFELCAIVTQHKRDMKFPTWKAAAADLGIPPSTLSTITCVRRIPEDLRPLTEELGPTVVRIIARMPDREQMRQGIEFASQEGSTKDKVDAFAQRLKEGNKPGAKPKKLQGKLGGRDLSVKLKDNDTGASLADALEEAAKRLRKHPTAPAAKLDFLFA